MLSGPRIAIRDISITAAGGTGQATFPCTYLAGVTIVLLCIKPTVTATYAVEVQDQDGFVIYAKTGLSDNSTISVQIPARDTCTVILTSATNTTYSVRLYLSHSAN